MATIEERVAALEQAGTADMAKDVREQGRDLREVQRDVRELKRDTAGLKQGQEELRRDMTASFAQVAKAMEQMEERITRGQADSEARILALIQQLVAMMPKQEE